MMNQSLFVNLEIIGKGRVAERCKVASDFMTRFLGWMGKADVEGQAVLFPECKSVHMWFMRTPIDIVFMKATSVGGQEYSVVKTISKARPWSLLPFNSFESDTVLEVPPGWIQKNGVTKGGRIRCLN